MQTPAEMRLLPNGVVQHDYGPFSCLSCGGRVTATHDEIGREDARCARCGPVEYIAVGNDAGEPVDGFMRPDELHGLPLQPDADPQP
ncbi:MAG: hypothetical protein EKK47_16725 [Burkholderiales bacterium]|nr:MAG: hypothetical protein EKK47_16725 [Burkholderiales bacterium]